MPLPVLVLLAVFFLAPLMACSSTSAEGADVDAVRAYVDALEPALSAEMLDPLRAAATEGQVERVRLYVTMQLGDGRRMSPALLELSITHVERSEDRSLVETRERWRVESFDAESGESMGLEQYDVVVGYTVTLADGKWRVSEVEELERETRELDAGE
ncbi:MAG: hypothetical protein OEV43_05945 [Coriobacteriia bacterium]|nr:hypothetical protein [Coriobacteriia bacterium]